MKSFKAILQEFKAANSGLPWYSPHASSFVIASKIARDKALPGYMNDWWWASANESGFMEIYNHSLDHDLSVIQGGPFYDFDAGAYVPAGWYSDQIGSGMSNFYRINNYDSSNAAVAISANFIRSKIGGWPDLFAYPFGHVSGYLRDIYFPNFYSQHRTFAAFSTEGAYVTRSSNRYSMGRFGNQDKWRTPSEFRAILSGAL